MKINTKLVGLFWTISIIVLSASSYAFYKQGRKIIAERVYDKLDSVAVLKTNQLTFFINEKIIDMNGYAKNKELTEIMTSLSEASSNIRTQAETTHHPIEEGKKDPHSILRDSLNSYPEHNFLELSILNLKGTVITSTNQIQEGKIFQNQPYFIEGLKGNYVQNFHYDPFLQQPTTIISVPIEDIDKKVVGVIAGRINVDIISQLMIERAGLGETGETYLVSKFNYLVSESRFKEDWAFKKVIHSDDIKECLAGNSGHYQGLDYRGEEVISSYQWLPNQEVCLIAKMDEYEAFEAMRMIKNPIILFGFIIALLSLIMSFFITKAITKPIKNLIKVTQDIAAGDLTQKALVSSNDEIGQLSKSFNKMTSKLLLQTKLAEEKQAQLQASIANLPLGFIMIDAKNSVAVANPAIERILNIKADSCTIKKISLALKNKHDVQNIIDRALKENNVLLINEAELNSGKYVKIYFIPVETTEKNRVVIGTVILIEDITETKMLAKTRNEFFAIASHELRTPLTVIHGNTSLISDYFSDKIKDKKLKAIIDDVQNSSKHLISIVEDFLDASRLEQKRLEFKNEEFDIVSLIKESISDLENLAKKKDISLKFTKVKTTTKNIWADKNKTKQVIINLINNGIKFTKVGKITVDATFDDSFVKVSITDTGVGIAPENQKMLFRKFTQTSSSTRTRDATQGSGLGLYISKLLIEGMGGVINLESSTINKGTTFSFALPLRTNNQS